MKLMFENGNDALGGVIEMISYVIAVGEQSSNPCSREQRYVKSERRREAVLSVISCLTVH